MRLRGVQKALVVLVGLALAATACGGDGAANTGTGDASNNKGKRGGTLKLLGQGDVNNLDPATSYELIAWGYVLRAMTRQLVTYPYTEDKERRNTPVPDLATKLPDVSADGRTYTFTLKKDVKFAPPANRPIVARDFITGVKRLCDPNNPSGGLGYFTDTIEGMQQFCAGFAKVKVGDINAVRAYVENNEIAGMKARAEDKLEIKLKRPAGDFVNLMATPFASPVPAEEALRYLADSKEFRQNFPASGPYMLAEYQPDKVIKMKRNPNQANGDEVRKAWVDKIEIVTNSSNDQVVQQQIEANQADMYFGGEPPVAAQQKFKNLNDSRLHIMPDGCVFYLVMNLRRNTPGGKALQNVKVRQALNIAYDKVAHLKVVGGENAGVPHGQVLGSTMLGFEKFDPYATSGDTGDPAKAKALLAAAGYPNGITLDYLYRPRRKGQQIATVLQDFFKKAGVTLNLKQVPDKDFYSKHLSKPDANDWDVSSVGWCPDWPGNGARTFFTPLLDGRKFGDGTTNYGHYNSPVVNKMVDQALAEQDPAKAEALWHAIDQKVMADAPWVPVYEANLIQFVSSRVQNWKYFPFANNADPTNVWLK